MVCQFQEIVSAHLIWKRDKSVSLTFLSLIEM